MKGRGVFVLLVLFGSLVSTLAAGPSDYFSEADKASYIKLLKSSKSYLGAKNTFYSVSTLKSLNADIPDKSKLCDSVKPQGDQADIYHAVATLELLGCSQALSEKATKDVKSALTSDSFNDLYYSISTVLILKKAKKIDTSDAEIQVATDKLLKLGEDDGTFRASSKSDDGSVLNGGLALQLLGQIASEISLNGDLKAKIESALDNAQDVFTSFSETHDDSIYLVDLNSRASNLKVTSTVLKGYNALAAALKRKVDSPEPEQVIGVAEYFVQKKHAGNAEEAYYVLEGLKTAASNVIGTPVVVAVTQKAISPSSKGEGIVNIRVTNVLGDDIPAKLVLVKASPANAEKVLVSNQDVPKEGSNYKFNFFAAKPEPGFYNLEFRVTPEKGSKALTTGSVVRSIKVVSTISVSDVQVIVADSQDSQDIAEGKKIAAEYPKSIDEVVAVEDYHHVFVNFKVKSQAGKTFQVQQAFVRVFDGQKESIVVAKFTGKQYSAHIVIEDIADDFFGQSGKYELQLIVGDSFVQNPVQWKVASLNVKFGDSKIEKPVSPFQTKPEIHHAFRAAEKRAEAPVSFAFTIATLAPIGLLLIGLLRVGANFNNFPSSGLGPIYAFGFQGSLGAVLGLYALYWLRLNMMQTLKYLGFLVIPLFYFASKTLNYLAANRKVHKD